MRDRLADLRGSPAAASGDPRLLQRELAALSAAIEGVESRFSFDADADDLATPDRRDVRSGTPASRGIAMGSAGRPGSAGPASARRAAAPSAFGSAHGTPPSRSKAPAPQTEASPARSPRSVSHVSPARTTPRASGAMARADPAPAAQSRSVAVGASGSESDGSDDDDDVAPGTGAEDEDDVSDGDGSDAADGAAGIEADDASGSTNAYSESSGSESGTDDERLEESRVDDDAGAGSEDEEALEAALAGDPEYAALRNEQRELQELLQERERQLAELEAYQEQLSRGAAGPEESTAGLETKTSEVDRAAGSATEDADPAEVDATLAELTAEQAGLEDTLHQMEDLQRRMQAQDASEQDPEELRVLGSQIEELRGLQSVLAQLRSSASSQAGGASGASDRGSDDPRARRGDGGDGAVARTSRSSSGGALTRQASEGDARPALPTTADDSRIEEATAELQGLMAERAELRRRLEDATGQKMEETDTDRSLRESFVELERVRAERKQLRGQLAEAAADRGVDDADGPHMVARGGAGGEVGADGDDAGELDLETLESALLQREAMRRQVKERTGKDVPVDPQEKALLERVRELRAMRAELSAAQAEVAELQGQEELAEAELAASREAKSGDGEDRAGEDERGAAPDTSDLDDLEDLLRQRAELRSKLAAQTGEEVPIDEDELMLIERVRELRSMQAELAAAQADLAESKAREAEAEARLAAAGDGGTSEPSGGGGDATDGPAASSPREEDTGRDDRDGDNSDGAETGEFDLDAVEALLNARAQQRAKILRETGEAVEVSADELGLITRVEEMRELQAQLASVDGGAETERKSAEPRDSSAGSTSAGDGDTDLRQLEEVLLQRQAARAEIKRRTGEDVPVPRDEQLLLERLRDLRNMQSALESAEAERSHAAAAASVTPPGERVASTAPPSDGTDEEDELDLDDVERQLVERVRLREKIAEQTGVPQPTPDAEVDALAKVRRLKELRKAASGSAPASDSKSSGVDGVVARGGAGGAVGASTERGGGAGGEVDLAALERQLLERVEMRAELERRTGQPHPTPASETALLQQVRDLMAAGAPHQSAAAPAGAIGRASRKPPLTPVAEVPDEGNDDGGEDGGEDGAGGETDETGDHAADIDALEAKLLERAAMREELARRTGTPQPTPPEEVELLAKVRELRGLKEALSDAQGDGDVTSDDDAEGDGEADSLLDLVQIERELLQRQAARQEVARRTGKPEPTPPEETALLQQVQELRSVREALAKATAAAATEDVTAAGPSSETTHASQMDAIEKTLQQRAELRAQLRARGEETPIPEAEAQLWRRLQEVRELQRQSREAEAAAGVGDRESTTPDDEAENTQEADELDAIEQQLRERAAMRALIKQRTGEELPVPEEEQELVEQLRQIRAMQATLRAAGRSGSGGAAAAPPQDDVAETKVDEEDRQSATGDPDGGDSPANMGVIEALLTQRAELRELIKAETGVEPPMDEAEKELEEQVRKWRALRGGAGEGEEKSADPPRQPPPAAAPVAEAAGGPSPAGREMTLQEVDAVLKQLESVLREQDELRRKEYERTGVLPPATPQQRELATRLVELRRLRGLIDAAGLSSPDDGAGEDPAPRRPSAPEVDGESGAGDAMDTLVRGSAGDLEAELQALDALVQERDEVRVALAKQAGNEDPGRTKEDLAFIAKISELRDLVVQRDMLRRAMAAEADGAGGAGGTSGGTDSARSSSDVADDRRASAEAELKREKSRLEALRAERDHLVASMNRSKARAREVMGESKEDVAEAKSTPASEAPSAGAMAEAAARHPEHAAVEAQLEAQLQQLTMLRDMVAELEAAAERGDGDGDTDDPEAKARLEGLVHHLESAFEQQEALRGNMAGQLAQLSALREEAARLDGVSTARESEAKAQQATNEQLARDVAERQRELAELRARSRSSGATGAEPTDAAAPTIAGGAGTGAASAAGVRVEVQSLVADQALLKQQLNEQRRALAELQEQARMVRSLAIAQGMSEAEADKVMAEVGLAEAELNSAIAEQEKMEKELGARLADLRRLDASVDGLSAGDQRDEDATWSVAPVAAGASTVASSVRSDGDLLDQDDATRIMASRGIAGSAAHTHEGHRSSRDRITALRGAEAPPSVASGGSGVPSAVASAGSAGGEGEDEDDDAGDSASAAPKPGAHWSVAPADASTVASSVGEAVGILDGASQASTSSALSRARRDFQAQMAELEELQAEFDGFDRERTQFAEEMDHLVSLTAKSSGSAERPSGDLRARDARESGKSAPSAGDAGEDEYSDDFEDPDDESESADRGSRHRSPARRDGAGRPRATRLLAEMEEKMDIINRVLTGQSDEIDKLEPAIRWVQRLQEGKLAESSDDENGPATPTPGTFRDSQPPNIAVEDGKEEGSSSMASPGWWKQSMESPPPRARPTTSRRVRNPDTTQFVDYIEDTAPAAVAKPGKGVPRPGYEVEVLQMESQADAAAGAGEESAGASPGGLAHALKRQTPPRPSTSRRVPHPSHDQFIDYLSPSTKAAADLARRTPRPAYAVETFVPDEASASTGAESHADDDEAEPEGADGVHPGPDVAMSTRSHAATAGGSVRADSIDGALGPSSSVPPVQAAVDAALDAAVTHAVATGATEAERVRLLSGFVQMLPSEQARDSLILGLIRQRERFASRPADTGNLAHQKLEELLSSAPGSASFAAHVLGELAAMPAGDNTFRASVLRMLHQLRTQWQQFVETSTSPERARSFVGGDQATPSMVVAIGSPGVSVDTASTAAQPGGAPNYFIGHLAGAPLESPNKPLLQSDVPRAEADAARSAAQALRDLHTPKDEQYDYAESVSTREASSVRSSNVGTPNAATSGGALRHGPSVAGAGARAAAPRTVPPAAAQAVLLGDYAEPVESLESASSEWSVVTDSDGAAPSSGKKRPHVVNPSARVTSSEGLAVRGGTRQPSPAGRGAAGGGAGVALARELRHNKMTSEAVAAAGLEPDGARRAAGGTPVDGKGSEASWSFATASDSEDGEQPRSASRGESTGVLRADRDQRSGSAAVKVRGGPAAGRERIVSTAGADMLEVGSISSWGETRRASQQRRQGGGPFGGDAGAMARVRVRPWSPSGSPRQPRTRRRRRVAEGDEEGSADAAAGDEAPALARQWSQQITANEHIARQLYGELERLHEDAVAEGAGSEAATAAFSLDRHTLTMLWQRTLDLLRAVDFGTDSRFAFSPGREPGPDQQLAATLRATFMRYLGESAATAASPLVQDVLDILYDELRYHHRMTQVTSWYDERLSTGKKGDAGYTQLARQRRADIARLRTERVAMLARRRAEATRPEGEDRAFEDSGDDDGKNVTPTPGAIRKDGKRSDARRNGSGHEESASESGTSNGSHSKQWMRRLKGVEQKSTVKDLRSAVESRGTSDATDGYDEHEAEVDELLRRRAAARAASRRARESSADSADHDEERRSEGAGSIGLDVTVSLPSEAEDGDIDASERMRRTFTMLREVTGRDAKEVLESEGVSALDDLLRDSRVPAAGDGDESDGGVDRRVRRMADEAAAEGGATAAGDVLAGRSVRPVARGSADVARWAQHATKELVRQTSEANLSAAKAAAAAEDGVADITPQDKVGGGSTDSDDTTEPDVQLLEGSVGADASDDSEAPDYGAAISPQPGSKQRAGFSPDTRDAARGGRSDEVRAAAAAAEKASAADADARHERLRAQMEAEGLVSPAVDRGTWSDRDAPAATASPPRASAANGASPQSSGKRRRRRRRGGGAHGRS